MTWSQVQVRPVRLQVTNATDRHLGVYLDNCQGHLRLGFAPPESTGRFRLPDRLIPFDGSIHLHMVDHQARSIFGIYAVPLEEDWTLTLTVSDSTPQAEKEYDDAEVPVPDSYRRPQGFQTFPGEEMSYASVWADDASAVLSWICSKGEASMVFSPADTEADELHVEVSFQGSSGRVVGPWMVLHGRTDNLRAPGPLADAITRDGLDAQTALLTVWEGDEPARHRFVLKGMREALKGLTCFPAGGDDRAP
ncbi:hypothetical protein ACFL5A_00155 [Gemmatimonadota bacterium]